MTSPVPNYLNAETTIRSWLLTTDHKRIGLLYLFTILFFFRHRGCCCGTDAGPNCSHHRAISCYRKLITKLFTIHGVLMVWFFLIPSIPNVLGNFLIPLMIGARDLHFPS